jgi:hypothetical protein
MRVCLGFLSTIRFWLLIKVVRLVGLVNLAAANSIGQRSGLNDALISCLESADRREAGSGPPSALYAISDRDH